MTYLQLYNKLNSILKKFFKLNNVKDLSIEYYKIVSCSCTPFITVWINYIDNKNIISRNFTFNIDNKNIIHRNFTFNINDEDLKDKIDKFIEFYDQVQNKATNM
ncbi:hypothetical protein [Clostridium sp.]|uniref:hypothetical protein n=1 Tax=Clostridium sp. TaxID=1506 RepID=UPI0025BC7260|nr:hypothetical protein [Clostridium sp.]